MKTLSLFLVISIFFAPLVKGQKQLAYSSYLKDYRLKYISEHEVVKIKDKKFFRFFKPDYTFRIECQFEKITDTTGFMMLTSSGKQSKYFIYGKVQFQIEETPFELFVYQSQNLMLTEKYADYLFIPFTDQTSGKESYGGGRYIDLLISDLKTGKFILDFNKAYNPYCAYAKGYNCPIPPRQNYLNFPLRVGERAFGKH